MKIVQLAIAGALAVGFAGAAQADRVVVHHERTVVTHRVVHPVRHKVCNTVWEHHHKVRRCHWR